MHGNMATHYSAEDMYVGNLYGALSQINCGVTTIYDWCHGIRDMEMAERALDGLEEAKIRALFGHGTAKPPAEKTGGVPFSHIPHPRERVEHLRNTRLTGNDGLIGLAMAILGPEYGTYEVARQDLALAREFGLRSTAHVWHGRNFTAEDQPDDPYAELAKEGLLGPEHNIVHANYITDDMLKTVTDAGVTVTSTVLVEAHGHGAEPLTGRVRDLGIMPSIGIDTALIVTDDMLSEMRGALVALRYRHHHSDREAGNYPPTVMPVKSREALEWATIGNARVMGLEDRIGSVTPGKKADLIMFDATADNIFPVHDPVHTVAEHAGAVNISDVMIDGVFQKRSGKLVYPDGKLEKLKGQVARSAERLMKAAGYEHQAA